MSRFIKLIVADVYNTMKTRVIPRVPTSFKATNQGLKSFDEVEIPEGTLFADFSNNHIIDFVGLQEIESLDNLVCDQNPIISFKGFPTLPNLKTLSLNGSPLQSLPNFRVLAVLAAGMQLESVNGVQISSADKGTALSFGDFEVAHSLIVRGWLPVRPAFLSKSSNKFSCPKDKKQMIKKMSKKYGERHLQETSTIKKQTSELSETKERTNQIAEMRKFIIDYYTPQTELQKPAKYPKRSSSDIDAQIDAQQKLIDAMAVQLETLRNGNATFNNYNEMLTNVAQPLFDNAEVLARLKGESIPERAITKKSDPVALRKAVKYYLDIDNKEEVADDILIAMIEEELDSQEEDGEDLFFSEDNYDDDDFDED